MKEARLQNPVPTNRNWIRGWSGRMRWHIILTSKGWETIKCLAGRSSGYWGKEYVLTWGDLGLHELETEKSADVIVVGGKEPLIDIVEFSQTDEGPNVNLLEIELGELGLALYKTKE